jgi:Flp pilus assembly protein TadD
MRRTTVWAGLFVWMALSASAFAQATTTAEGFVLDNDGNPIADAKVLLDFKGHVIQKYHTKTDKKGKFVHVNVYAGTYDVTVSKEGLGEATFKDFAIHDIGSTEKAPVFRIGRKKTSEAAASPDMAAAGAAPGAEAGMAPPAAPAPLPAEVAGALAADLEKAGAAMKAGRLDEAIAGYEAVAAKAPNLPQLHHNLGLAYARKKDMPKAEAELRKAVELKPDFTEAHSALSIVLYEKGNREEALSEAAHAVEGAPDNARLQFSLGVMYADAGRAAEAKEALLKAESLDPTDAEVEFQLGTLAVAANQKAEAISRMERYLGMAPPGARNVASAKGMIAALKR